MVLKDPLTVPPVFLGYIFLNTLTSFCLPIEGKCLWTSPSCLHFIALSFTATIMSCPINHDVMFKCIPRLCVSPLVRLQVPLGESTISVFSSLTLQHYAFNS